MRENIGNKIINENSKNLKSLKKNPKNPSKS